MNNNATAQKLFVVHRERDGATEFVTYRLSTNELSWTKAMGLAYSFAESQAHQIAANMGGVVAPVESL